MDNRNIGSRVPTLGLHHYGRVVADGEALEDSRSPYHIQATSSMNKEEDFIDGTAIMSGLGHHQLFPRQDSYDRGYSSLVYSKPSEDTCDSWEQASFPSILDEGPALPYVPESEPYSGDFNEDEAYGSISSLPSSGTIFAQDMDGDTMLHVAIIHENEPMALSFINAAEKVYDLSLVNALGQTALHLASYVNMPGVVEALVRRQVALDTRNRDGNTALHLACREGHTDVARMLVTAQPGLTTVMNYDGLTCLHLAVKHEQIRVVELLMQSGIANVNAGDGCSGRTVLHHAVQAGNQDWVQFLIKECKADVNVAARDGLTPLMIAVGQQRHNLVDMLTQAGAIYLTALADDDGFCSEDDDSVDMEANDLYRHVAHLTLNGEMLTNGHITSEPEDIYS